MYVLAYYTDRTDAHSFHCVFVKSITEDQFNCINSWGEKKEFQPNPQVPIKQNGNMLWKITLKYERTADRKYPS